MAAFTVLFLFGICINILSLYKLTRKRLANKGSRMTLLLIHLSAADLIVTLFHVPEALQIRLRGDWKADDVTCKIYCFFWPLGFYISGFVMMVISVDRWSAIIHPLTHRANPRRTKIMLAMAWLLTLVFSIPNSFVYQLKTNPHTENRKCEAYYINDSPEHSSDQMELLYEAFVLTLTCLLPLITMLGCYTSMIVHLYRRSKTKLGQQGAGWVAEAKVKTVKITFVLALGFVICWTPYNVCFIWWRMNKKAAEDSGLWYLASQLACVNNCLNPLFYGIVGKKWISRNMLIGNRKMKDLIKKTTITETPETKASAV